MTSELLLTLIVAIIVFGPNKLPMLARHLSHALKQFNQLKQYLSGIWDEHVKALQLQDNQHKAKLADKHYEQNSQFFSIGRVDKAKDVDPTDNIHR